MKTALTLFSLVTSLALSVPAYATPPCQQISAKGRGQNYGNGTTTATIVGGPIAGSSSAAFSILSVVGTVASLDGFVDIATSFGTITVQVTGTFDLASGKFDVSGPITQGTGLLLGASGTLHFQGVEDATTGEFSEKVTGQLCRGGAC